MAGTCPSGRGCDGQKHGDGARVPPYGHEHRRCLLVLLGAANANTSLVKAGGYAVFLFALVGVYLYFGALSVATDGKPVPMGRPILYG